MVTGLASDTFLRKSGVVAPRGVALVLVARHHLLRDDRRPRNGRDGALVLSLWPRLATRTRREVLVVVACAVEVRRGLPAAGLFRVNNGVRVAFYAVWVLVIAAIARTLEAARLSGAVVVLTQRTRVTQRARLVRSVRAWAARGALQRRRRVQPRKGAVGAFGARHLLHRGERGYPLIALR